MSMTIPDQVVIIERHPNAEQPYNLVKEIYKSIRIVNGKQILVETSRLTTKNIRPKGSKPGIIMTKEELEKKRRAEMLEEQTKNQELLAKAEKSKTGDSDDVEAKKEEKKNDQNDSPTEAPKDYTTGVTKLGSSTGGKATK